MSETAAPLQSVFRHRAFALYWFSRIASILSFQMLVVAVGWQLYELTGSAFDLGLLGLAQFAPMLLLTLVVGHVADRHDHRRILMFCQIAEGCAAALLVFSTLTGSLGTPVIYAAVALVGAARGFEIPTMAAIIPDLVPREDVQRAMAWFASANQTGQIVGPALGGLLYLLGPAAVYGITIALWCLGGFMLALMRFERGPRSTEPFGLASLLGGFRFVRHDRIILGTLSLDMFAVFLGGATALLPIFARDILQTGPWGLGLLRAAPGAGALVMSVILARRPLTLPVGTVLFSMLTIFGLAVTLFAFSTVLWLSMVALALMGAADVVSVVIRFSLVQLRTPPQMRGRVSAVNGLFTGTSNQLGDFRAGVVGALFGAVPAVAIGGLGTILVTLIWMFLFPELRRIRSLDEATELKTAQKADEIAGTETP
ncbi:MAG: MFS transporter [Alphaproteobacteria bacterium]|nr:MFS transporter [Alphaproteobacteria bacterium]